MSIEPVSISVQHVWEAATLTNCKLFRWTRGSELFSFHLDFVTDVLADQTFHDLFQIISLGHLDCILFDESQLDLSEVSRVR